MSSSSSQLLLADNEIEIRVIKPLERQKVLDFLRIHYYLEEPLTAGSEPRQQDKEDEEFNMSNIDHGTCVMAVKCKKDTKEDQEEIILGALMAGPKGPDEAEHLFEEAALLGPTKWGHTIKFLAGIERDANVCERYQVQKVLHVHVMGVDTKLRGQNIGGRLITKVIELAKQLKFELITTDCTSFYSARLFERIGFDLINTKYYTEYLDENKKQVFKPDPIHECTRTYAMKL